MNRPTVLDARQTHDLPLAGIRLIEASAGTGKTYAIANLYLRYVLAGYACNQILVVTFTNAATEELRGRIRQRLHQAALLLENPEKQKECNDEFLLIMLQEHQNEELRQQVLLRLKLAVRTMDEAAIHTIHGFCQRTLTDHAFYSGQNFAVTLGNDDDQLWTACLKDWWRAASYELDPTAGDLFAGSLGSLPAFIGRQKQLRQTHGIRLLPESPRSLEQLYREWLDCAGELKKLAAEWQQRHDMLKSMLLESKALSRAEQAYKEARLHTYFDEWDDYFFGQTVMPFPASLAMLSAATLQANTKKTAKDDPSLQDSFFLDCQTVIDRFDEIRTAFRIRALLDATAYAAEKVESIRQSSATMTFNDQLTRLHAALSGSQGQLLAAHLRQSFPVAMIDEFQDTDAIQYGIFRMVYGGEDSTTSLLMIGDPKQAIYSFRGGDIFTYMQARKDAGSNLYTLDTNWRSTPGLVKAVNTLFSFRDEPFVYAEAIAFNPVQASGKSAKAGLLSNGIEQTPLCLWQLPLDETGKPLTKRVAESLVQDRVAEEVASLLIGSQAGQVKLGDQPVRAGDIAILVRTGRQGAAVRDALARHGINAVTVGRANVFETEEAHGLLALLEALVHPTDRQLLRKALGSNLLGLYWPELLQQVEEESSWLSWCRQIQVLSGLWQQKGFMTMFQSLLQTLDIGTRMATEPAAERRLTNLLHLSELLQQQARIQPGTSGLLSWYRQQLDDREMEAELRLESDADLVRIVTIHASKGLEYPIVFCPFLWSARATAKNTSNPLFYHDREGNACLDLGSQRWEQHLFLSEKEKLAEDIRLCYVALTRAVARLYLVWGESQRAQSEKSGLAYLLHHGQTADELNYNLPAAYKGRVEITPVFAALEQAGEGTIDSVQLALEASQQDSMLLVSEDRLSVLQPAVFSGQVATDWRLASFSSLTRDIHQTAHSGKPRSAISDDILAFPAGSHVGLFLHSLLEDLDFCRPVGEQMEKLFAVHAPRYGFAKPEYAEVLCRWLDNIVKTTLSEETGLRLEQLSGSRRLNELAFDFAVSRVSPLQLNNLLEKFSGKVLAPVSGSTFRGMVTGVIDLVFESEGRYFIADYKSNFLGATLPDYEPAALQQAIDDRRYDLQYLLYSLALHRYLGKRLPDYSYQQHFGGVYYLFLRGMRPQHGPRYGVFHDLPDARLITGLDRLFAGSGEEVPL